MQRFPYHYPLCGCTLAVSWNQEIVFSFFLFSLCWTEVVPESQTLPCFRLLRSNNVLLMWRIIYNSSVVYHRPVWVLRSAVTSAAEHWYWLGLAWLSRCATLRMCFVVLKELGTILLVVGYFLQWKMCEAQFVVLPSHSFGCGLTVDYSLAGLVNSIALKVTEHRGTNAVVISSLPCQVWRVLGNLFDKQVCSGFSFDWSVGGARKLGVCSSYGLEWSFSLCVVS